MSFPLKLDRPLVVFDIETTGLNPRSDRIIELAAIRVEPTGEETSKRWRLNPGIHIPSETTQIHGITDDDVKGCQKFADVANEIEAFFAGCDVSGFNCDRFDVPCLEAEFERVGKSFDDPSRRHVDVQRIYHRKEPRDLTAAVRFYCGRDHVGAHGAEADARATLDVLKAQFAKYPDLPDTTEALDLYLVPRDPLNADRQGLFRWINGQLCVNFGQMRGKRLVDMFTSEKKWLKWFAGGNFAPDARAIARNLLEKGVLPSKPPEASAK